MQIEIIRCPDDAHWHSLRERDLTASTIAALLGVHARETPFALFARKSGIIKSVDVEDSPDMRRGRLLEPVAVAMLREDHPDWKIAYNSGDDRHYYRDDDARIGATPDVLVTCPKKGRGIIQIKSVAARTYRSKWIEDGEPNPPVWIGIQALIECDLTGAQWAAVAPLVIDDFGGLEMPLLDVPLHHELLSTIRTAAKEFWQRVAENRPYAPDYAKDADLLMSAYAQDNGRTIDLSGNNRVGDLLGERELLKAVERQGDEARKERKALDAEIIHMLGEATRARLADGRILEAKTVSNKGYFVEPFTYRSIRLKRSA